MPDHTARQSPSSSRTSRSAEETERRATERYPLIAPAEVLDVCSRARISGRMSDFSVQGCYIDTLTPLPVGALVRLRLTKSKGIFESEARVCYSHADLGMGFVFTDLEPARRAMLEEWLKELNVSPAPAFRSPRPEQAEHLPSPDRIQLVRLIHMLIAKGLLTEAEGTVLLRDSLP